MYVIAHVEGFEPIPEGKYLVSYDPDYVPEGYEGAKRSGISRWSDDIAEARVFADAGVAMQFWRQQSITVPLRDDGKPNRPLTAFSIGVEKIDA